MMWEFWINRFQWGMVAKHSINPKNYYYAAALIAALVTALPEEVDGKNRLESEQKLFSNLFLCLREKGKINYTKDDHIWIFQRFVTQGW